MSLSEDDSSSTSSSDIIPPSNRARAYAKMMSMTRRYWPIPAEVSKRRDARPAKERGRRCRPDNASRCVYPSCSRDSSSSDDDSHESESLGVTEVSESSSIENIPTEFVRAQSSVTQSQEGSRQDNSCQTNSDSVYEDLDSVPFRSISSINVHNAGRSSGMFQNIGPFPTEQQAALVASMVESVYRNPVIDGLLTACYHPSPDYCEEPTRPYENETKNTSAGPGNVTRTE